MTGVRKPKSREAFNLNMNDAETLVSIAKLLENERIYRMRAELRTRIGTALRIPKANIQLLSAWRTNKSSSPSSLAQRSSEAASYTRTSDPS